MATTLARVATVIGWTGLALILLACIWLSTTTLYPGIAALLPTLGAALVIGAGCATPTRARPCARVAADARHRADLLFLVPVALAGADFRSAIAGTPTGVGRQVGSARSGGLAWLTLRFLENPLRFAPRVRRSPLASLGLGGAPP